MTVIIRKIRTFFSLDISMLLILIEAFLFLGWARILLYFPFSKITSLLGYHMEETSFADVNRHAEIQELTEALNIMSRHTFWESKCLVRAIAGMAMLKRRKLESTLYLGTGKDASGKMIAHAWLRCGNSYITGAEVMSDFTVVSLFGSFFKGSY